MDKKLTENLLACAAAYGNARGCAEATVGNASAGDSRFFARLRAGKTFTIRKYDAVMAWFEANWPDDLEWPANVMRPSSEAQSAA